MAPSFKTSAAREPWPIPPRTLLRPPVVFELLLGLSPLIGVLWWGWDMYRLVMLHVLALAVSGAWLTLRTLVLSRDALGYFNPAWRTQEPEHDPETWDDDSKKSHPAPGGLPRARLLLAGFTLVVLAVPLVLLGGVITDEFGGPWRAAIHGVGDIWRVLVVDTGLWLPLACVCAWEAVSFAADVALPFLPLTRRFNVPARPVAAGYRSLSRELQAFLYVRAFVVLRMIVTVLALGIGLFVAGLVGGIAIGVLLVLLKTGVAVFLEAGAVVDADNAGRRQAVRQ